MRDQPLHMWRYWRDDKGLETALTEYYPATLARNPQIAAAWVQLRNAELAINTIMNRLCDEAEDDE